MKKHSAQGKSETQLNSITVKFLADVDPDNLRTARNYKFNILNSAKMVNNMLPETSTTVLRRAYLVDFLRELHLSRGHIDQLLERCVDIRNRTGHQKIQYKGEPLLYIDGTDMYIDEAIIPLMILQKETLECQ